MSESGIPAIISCLDGGIGGETLATVATTVKGAINELAASGGGGGGVYTPVGTLRDFYEFDFGAYRYITSGSTDLSSHMLAWQKCANWAKEKTFEDSDYIGAHSALSHIFYSYYDYGTVFDFPSTDGLHSGDLEGLCKWAIDH